MFSLFLVVLVLLFLAVLLLPFLFGIVVVVNANMCFWLVLSFLVVFVVSGCFVVVVSDCCCCLLLLLFLLLLAVVDIFCIFPFCATKQNPRGC